MTVNGTALLGGGIVTAGALGGLTACYGGMWTVMAEAAVWGCVMEAGWLLVTRPRWWRVPPRVAAIVRHARAARAVPGWTAGELAALADEASLEQLLMGLPDPKRERL